MLIYQQIQNIGMTVGVFPITGITLPYISYGGSSLISYMIVAGKRAGEGVVEVKCRMTGDKTEETIEDAINKVVNKTKGGVIAIVL